MWVQGWLLGSEDTDKASFLFKFFSFSQLNCVISEQNYLKL